MTDVDSAVPSFDAAGGGEGPEAAAVEGPMATGCPGAYSDASSAELSALAVGLSGPIGIAVDSANVYWTNEFGGTVTAAALDGGITSIVASLQMQPTGIAVQGGSVCWTNYDGDSIACAPLDGGGVTTIAAAQGQPFGITAGATGLDWVDEGAGTVMTATPGGGPPVVLASSQGGPTSVAADTNSRPAVPARHRGQRRPCVLDQPRRDRRWRCGDERAQGLKPSAQP